MIILETKNLSKTYNKNIVAVNNLNLNISKGNIYGILGPNGSGKTTTLGMILGIINPTSGSYNWFEERPSAKSRKRIGAILETPNFYPYMDAKKNLEIIAHIKQVKNNKIPELIDLVGLSGRVSSPFSTYSLGMKQRLAIAGALIGDPEVLIFDEPTNGLDPQGIVEVRNLLIKIGQRGKTILLASHIIDEVEKVCDHVAIIKYGQLLVSGSVSEVLSNEPIIEVSSVNLIQLKNVLSKAPFVISIREDSSILELKIKDGFSPSDINKFLFEKDIVINHLKVRKKSLETEFLERTN
ncbi:MAG: ABC transporter ATP-binding protein [Saprospiraceae bacterium]|nr:ABC transporter ATP-binding protein [Saprospiraceae bacterium]